VEHTLVELQEKLLLRVLLHGIILLLVQEPLLLIWMVLVLLGEKEEMEVEMVRIRDIEQQIKDMVVMLFTAGRITIIVIME
jgi:hypothetical protein